MATSTEFQGFLNQSLSALNSGNWQNIDFDQFEYTKQQNETVSQLKGLAERFDDVLQQNNALASGSNELSIKQQGRQDKLWQSYDNISKMQLDVVNVIEAISEGDFTETVNKKSKDDVLNGALAKVIDNLRATVEKANSIAQGDYTAEIQPRSDKDALGKALFSITQSLQEAGDVCNAIATGDTSRKVQVKGKDDQLAKQASLEAEESKSRLQALLNSAGEGVIGMDIVGNISFANPKACKILEIENKDLISRNLQEFLVSEIDGNLLVNNDARSPTNKCFRQFDITDHVADGLTSGERWRTDSGTIFYVEYTSEVTLDKNGKNIGGVVMFQNVTERKQNEYKLHHLANFDSLTDLANRAYFYDHLRKAIARFKRNRNDLAVLYIDLDHFKLVNDQYGHDTGDALLQYVSAMLRSSVREGDLVARMGGDEFAIILYDIDDANGMATVAQKILNKVDKPIEIQGIKLSVSVSVGIAYYEGIPMTIEQLLKSADTAMYSAKLQGRNNYQFFSASMHEKVQEKQHIQVMLQQAVINQELSLVYQPQVSLSKNNIVGCEALLRWQPKEGAAISPDKFIPIAEESGQIEELGEWVLSEVCQQVAQWSKSIDFKGLTVSINVSVRQLTTDKFYNTLAFLLKKYDVSPKFIEIEITETAMSTNYAKLVEELDKIRQLGVAISMDDFGTGHASLDNLRKLPLNKLKIDRSFIQDIGIDPCDEDITKVIMAIAKKMSLDLVAEGAETVEQLAFLSAEDCDIIQGYYFSKPVSPEQLFSYLQDNENLFEEKFKEYHVYLEKRDSIAHPVVELIRSNIS